MVRERVKHAIGSPMYICALFPEMFMSYSSEFTAT